MTYGMSIALVTFFIVGFAFGCGYTEYRYTMKPNRNAEILRKYKEFMAKLGITDEEDIQEIIKGKTFDEIERINQRLKRTNL